MAPVDGIEQQRKPQPPARRDGCQQQVLQRAAEAHVHLAQERVDAADVACAVCEHVDEIRTDAKGPWRVLCGLGARIAAATSRCGARRAVVPVFPGRIRGALAGAEHALIPGAPGKRTGASLQRAGAVLQQRSATPMYASWISCGDAVQCPASSDPPVSRSGCA
jgi:hypothetical protein